MKFVTPRLKTLLLVNANVVGTYLLTGKISLILVPEFVHATPIFLPAGIAFAAVVSYGACVLPGVVIGALWLSLLVPSSASIDFPIGSATVTALAACLQAWVGMWLFKRWVRPAIDTGRDVLAFLLLALFTGLLAPTIQLLIRCLPGVRTVDELAVNWLVGCMGGAAGIILASPLCWIFIGHPRSLWWRQRILFAIPMLLSCAAVIATYQKAYKWEEEKHLHNFHVEANEAGNLLQAQFDEHERVLLVLSNAINDAEHLAPARFTHIAQGYLHGRPELRAFGWIRRVSDAQRADFERWANEKIASGFRIHDLAVGVEGTRSPRRDLYYPSTFIAPSPPPHLLGLDYLSEPIRAEAIAEALSRHSPAASAPIRLHVSKTPGIIIMQAVYSNNGAQEPAGFLCIVLEMKSFLAGVLSTAQFNGFLADLDDITDSRKPISIHQAISLKSRAGEYRKLLTFGARSYLLRIAPSQGYLEQHRNWDSFTVLGAGMALMTLLAALLLLISGERARIFAQVKVNTAKLHEQEARLQAILDHAADAILTVTQDGTVLSGNAAAAAVFGYPPDEMTGLPLARFLPENDAETMPCLLDRLASSDLHEHEQVGYSADGSKLPLTVSVSALKLLGEHLFVCVLHDMTGQQHIHRLAHYDPLTGLKNRFALNEHLEKLLAQLQRSNESLAVLFIDLDHFKKVNDSHGHQNGDLLLIAVAERLEDIIRDIDTIARLGGDEFIVLISGTLTPDGVAGVASRIVSALNAPYELSGASIHSGASIGVSMFPNDGADASTLMRHADMAMYAAKGEGRGNFQFFSEAMNAETRERLLLENRLWLALKQEEFELYLQPQISMEGSMVIGAEALLRWHHPELGLVGPDRFIPIAEESGIIVPLGEWVLAQAIKLLAKWKKEGSGHLRLAINLSARQCNGNSLLPFLDQQVADSGVDPTKLELEITESAAMQDPERTRALLCDLRERGVSVAIDDFGTGYSSLSYLKLFAIDRIKIDRGFVKDIETDPNNSVIVAAIIALAHSLGLEVVAEGVETQAQYDYLKGKKCDEAQGFLFARPMPISQFNKIFAQ